MVKFPSVVLPKIQVTRKAHTVLQKGRRACLNVPLSVPLPEPDQPPAFDKTPMNQDRSEIVSNRFSIDSAASLQAESQNQAHSTASQFDVVEKLGGENAGAVEEAATADDPLCRFRHENEDNPWLNQTIRIGCSAVMNQYPLNYKLLAAAEEFGVSANLVWDAPALQMDKLLHGEVDAALVSLVDFFRCPEFPICSDACFSSEGAVRSVLLYGRNPASNIRTLGVESGTETSAVMAQILLAEQFGVTPEVRTLPVGSNWERANVDAVLLWGDRALCPPSRGENFVFVWDLGLRWTQWTGVPFVYNLWLAKDKSLAKLMAPIFSFARDRGVESLGEIAASEALRLKIEPSFCLDYLSNKIMWRMAGRQRKGVEIFCRLAKKHGLIDIGAPIPFNNHLRFKLLHEKMEREGALREAGASRSVQSEGFGAEI